MDLKIEIIIFIALISTNSLVKGILDKMKAKTPTDWFIDLSNLFVQGILVKILQLTVLFEFMEITIPSLKSKFHMAAPLAFCLNFILVDYLYYWAHRALHSLKFWPWHRVHHSAEVMDVFVSSRNSYLTTFLIPYIWVNAFFIFILSENAKTWFLFSMSLTAALDAWRHSKLELRIPLLQKILENILITPKEHAWHHSKKHFQKNYGANLVIWDKIHGTYAYEPQYPNDLGIPIEGSLSTKLFFPWRIKRSAKQ